MATTSAIKVVIFCGGVGTRMWPMSRNDFPKQFQPLVGNESMFKQAYDRVKTGFDVADIYVATEERHIHYVQSQAPDLPQDHIFIEPEKRDTAGAVALAAARIHHQFPEATMAAIWGADHIIEDTAAFITAVHTAANVADSQDAVVRIGAKATFPNIYDGWIETGKQLEKNNGVEVREILHFHEKPDLHTAKKYFSSIKYFINTGYLITKTKKLLDLYQQFAPAIYESVTTIANATGQPEFDNLLRTEYAKVQKESVEYVISEKVDPRDLRAVVADMGWIDVGTWQLLYAGLSRTESDNVIQATTKTVDTKGSVIYGKEGKLIATIGVSNLCIIDTEDALLVCDLQQTDKVKDLIEQLKQEDADKYL
jgi:mannose-1-phosphate guanylyltransferase